MQKVLHTRQKRIEVGDDAPIYEDGVYVLIQDKDSRDAGRTQCAWMTLDEARDLCSKIEACCAATEKAQADAESTRQREADAMRVAKAAEDGPTLNYAETMEQTLRPYIGH